MKITEEENSMISMSLRSFKIQSYYILGILL
ncbi:ATP synthase subunit I, partial [Klebsiella pneumoniae]